MEVGINFLPGAGTGIASYTKNLLIALGQQVESKVSAFVYGQRVDRPEWLPETINYCKTQLPGRLQYLLKPPTEQLFQCKNLDLVHNFEPAILPTQTASMITVYDVSWRGMGSQYYSLTSPAWIARAESAIKEASSMCAISQTTANALIAGGVSSRKITVTPLGVDPSFSAVSIDEVQMVRRKYSLPAQFLLFTGHVNVRKNLRVLIKAIAEKKLPLIISGPLPAEGLTYWGLDASHIQHIGYLPQEDMPGLFAAASALIFPSFCEGFGLPLIEAMAVGTPVVASDIPVFREVGAAVPLYFDPDDPQQLRKLLDRLLGSPDLQIQMGESGRERATIFTWEQCCEATLGAYRSVLSTAHV
jgi:glycosyltransferase involved in cell wall biosynthesis